MEVISIECSTYEVIDFVASLVEELLTSFNSFVSQMMVMAGRGTDKRLGEWLDRSNSVRLPEQESGRMPDTEYQPKNFLALASVSYRRRATDAPPERNVGILSNRA